MSGKGGVPSSNSIGLEDRGVDACRALCSSSIRLRRVSASPSSAGPDAGRLEGVLGVVRVDSSSLETWIDLVSELLSLARSTIPNVAVDPFDIALADIVQPYPFRKYG